MIYMTEFTFPDIELEYSFLMGIKRTCYDTFYPFQTLSRHGLRRLDFEPITILYGGNGSGKTTALNVIAEKAGIRRESAGMTVLLVSQRIATVMKADHILCMEDGRVCGFGSHQDLMTDCEPYRAIYNSQIGE